MLRGVKKKIPTSGRHNAEALSRECEWFSRLAEVRIGLYFEQGVDVKNIRDVKPPDLKSDKSEYAKLVSEAGLSLDERLVLILALIPHVKPQLLDIFMERNKNLDRGYTEFGGHRSKTHGGFLPTWETAVFLLAGDDLAKRIELLALFNNEHYFAVHDILRHETNTGDDPKLSAVLAPTAATVSRLTTGVSHDPDVSVGVPAKLASTQLSWEDLVLSSEVMNQVNHIITWINNRQTILDDWGLSRHVKPGFCCLFHGPSGTGKTLTATLVGIEAGADVYRVDLSAVVSKYIGETEKNLARVFDRAENKNWILFFDEADALFGKRTQVTDAHDRYANQEVSYLLQRVEDFPGLVIFATNSHSDIDEAIARHFQLVINFPIPDTGERLKLWEGVIGDKYRLHPDVDLSRFASEYSLSGGAITNVALYGLINALQAGRDSVNSDDLMHGIRQELNKEGQTI